MNKIKSILSNAWFKIFGNNGPYNVLVDETAFVINNDVDIDECERIKKKIDEILDKNDASIVWEDPEGADQRIFQYQEFDLCVANKLNIKQKIKNIEDYTGRKIKAWLLMAARISATKNNLGSGGGWHKDSALSHQVKCIWYLSNVDEKSGPFQYVKGTNRIEKYKKGRLNQTRFLNVDDKIETVTGKAGDLLVCDTLCVHRGMPIENGDRYAITLYTFHSKRSKLKMLNEIYK